MNFYERLREATEDRHRKGTRCHYLLIQQKETVHISMPVLKYSR